jgi:hypothetical protein
MEKPISKDPELEKIMDELRSIVIPSPDYGTKKYSKNNQKVLALLDRLRDHRNIQKESHEEER